MHVFKQFVRQHFETIHRKEQGQCCKQMHYFGGWAIARQDSFGDGQRRINGFKDADVFLKQLSHNFSSHIVYFIKII